MKKLIFTLLIVLLVFGSSINAQRYAVIEIGTALLQAQAATVAAGGRLDTTIAYVGMKDVYFGDQIVTYQVSDSTYTTHRDSCFQLLVMQDTTHSSAVGGLRRVIPFMSKVTNATHFPSGLIDNVANLTRIASLNAFNVNADSLDEFVTFNGANDTIGVTANAAIYEYKFSLEPSYAYVLGFRLTSTDSAAAPTTNVQVIKYILYGYKEPDPSR